jgi:hypothetical protein
MNRFTPVFRLIAGLATAVSCVTAPSATVHAAETDASKVVQVPTLALPSAGTVFQDPAFGSTIQRIANPLEFGSNQMRPEYSQLQAWNSDGSLILLNSGLILDAKSYTLAHKIDYRWPAHGEALRWSPTNPRRLYYIGGGLGGCATSGLYEYNLDGSSTLTGSPKLVRCFPEYESLYKDQSWEEISDDGRIIALVGKKAASNKWGYVNEAFAYDIVGGTKHQALELPINETWGPLTGDFAAASPSGKYVLVQFPAGTARFNGLEAFDLEMNYAGKVHTGSGHGDLIRDASGAEWALIDNANNAYLFSGAHYIVKARIPSGVIFDTAGNVDANATANANLTVRLLQLDWFHHIHISCRNVLAPSFCVFGTYQTKEGYDNGWQPFETEVVKLDLDSTYLAPRVERLAHHRSAPYAISPRDACAGKQSYWAQPHATVRPDGQQLIFGSNWGRICDASEPVDAFVIELGPVTTVNRPLAPKEFGVRATSPRFQ